MIAVERDIIKMEGESRVVPEEWTEHNTPVLSQDSFPPSKYGFPLESR